jgi:hypothetical protein
VCGVAKEGELRKSNGAIVRPRRAGEGKRVACQFIDKRAGHEDGVYPPFQTIGFKAGHFVGTEWRAGD